MGLASCEAEKKRLIAEEKYEDVIAIRDTAKKMEKRLLPIEKIDELKSFYENAHGRAFSSLCLDRLAEMNIAEKLIEEFRKLIEKTANFSQDVEVLKEIKTQKTAFVE